MKSFTVFLLFRGINFFKSTLRASPQGVADFSGFPLRINSNFPSFLFPFCLDVCSINFSDADILFAIIPNWKGIWKIRIFDNTSLAWTLIEFEIFGILEMEDCIEVWVHAARKDFFFFYYYLIFYIEAEGRKGSNGLNLYLALKYITLRRKFTSLARTIKDITKADIML